MKAKIWCVVYVLFAHTTFNVLASDDNNEWTWLYHKIFTEQELNSNRARKELGFSKLNVEPFSQLVFSWNAYRPEVGHYSFWIQARDIRTGSWGPWHHMMDWGAGIQRSYVSKPDGLSEYVHVRLEVPSSRANGFRIKIVGHGAVDMSLLRSLSVSISDFARFRAEGIDNSIRQLPTVHIPGVPKLSQLVLEHPRKEVLCSPTTCSMLVGFLMDSIVEPLDFAEKSFDHGLKTYGSWPFNMAHAFERCGGSMYFATARASSFKVLYSRLRQGIPVGVSVRGPLEGAPLPYAGGHLLMVVGWDRERQAVICHDPALPHNHAVEKRYPIHSFLRAWERSHRLIYLAEPALKGS